MNNSQIAHVMERIGLLLELKGENPFKTQAYYRASLIMAALPFSLEVPDAQEHLRNISGIGEALEKKILVLLKTEELGYQKKLESEIPPVMIEMMRIPGLGPKKIRRLVETARVHGRVVQKTLFNIGNIENWQKDKVDECITQLTAFSVRIPLVV